MSGLFQDVLHHSGNPLLPMCSAIELHGRVNFFIEDQYPFTGLTLRTTSPLVTELIAMLKARIRCRNTANSPPCTKILPARWTAASVCLNLLFQLSRRRWFLL